MSKKKSKSVTEYSEQYKKLNLTHECTIFTQDDYPVLREISEKHARSFRFYLGVASRALLDKGYDIIREFSVSVSIDGTEYRYGWRLTRGKYEFDLYVGHKDRNGRQNTLALDKAEFYGCILIDDVCPAEWLTFVLNEINNVLRNDNLQRLSG